MWSTVAAGAAAKRRPLRIHRSQSSRSSAYRKSSSKPPTAAKSAAGKAMLLDAKKRGSDPLPLNCA